MKKKNLLWVITIIVVGIVTAAWLFTISGGFTMMVKSPQGYATLELDIPSVEVNTTLGGDAAFGYVGFLINKEITLNVSIDEVFQDLSGGECPDGINDCTTIYRIYNKTKYYIISDGQPISLKSFPQIRNISLEFKCNAYSCPQSRTADIMLTEVI